MTAVEHGAAVQRAAHVVDLRRAGAYQLLTLAAPEVAANAQPGQFVAVAVGSASGTVLHRSFAIYRAGPEDGTVALIFSISGPGTSWLADRRIGDAVDIVGPLGQPFPLPDEAAACTVVGGGYGSAPLFALGEALLERGCPVEVVLGAATKARLFGVDDALAVNARAAITTEDGSAGTRGLVTDVLPDVLDRSGTTVVYACGPMPMLAAVTRVATAAGAQTYTSVEEAMACGIGVCQTCVVPLVGDDGVTRLVRSCIEGPVFPAERVRWDLEAATRPMARPGRSLVAAPSRDPGLDGALDVAAARGAPAVPAVDMATRIGPLELPNPVLAASGSGGTGRELAPYLDVAALGALVTASVTLEPREGAPTPRMAETPSGMLSDTGLPGPGIEAFLTDDLPELAGTGARAIVSIAGSSPAEYAELGRRLAAAPGVAAVEINLACRDSRTGVRFSTAPLPAAGVVSAVRAAIGDSIPVYAKLSPAVTDLVDVARACLDAGADALTLISPLRGLVIDKRTLRPVLPGGSGELSGPAIRPVAVRCVHEVRAALPEVAIVGVGGIRTGLDALEFLAAGASAVQVGTTIFGDPGAPARILSELDLALTTRGFSCLSDAVGIAHLPR